MTKRIEKVKKKLPKKTKTSKAKNFVVEVNKTAFVEKVFHCINCNSEVNIPVLGNISDNETYPVQICLFCHPIKTKKYNILDDTGRLKVFMERYNKSTEEKK